MTKLTILFAIASVVLLTSCSKQEQAQPGVDTTKPAATTVQEGQGKAIVRAIDTTAKTITLDHGTVGNIMDAMTMEYPVANSAMLHAVGVGDSVTFRLQDRGDGNYVVTRITSMPKH